MRLFWRDVFSQQPGISWQTARDFLLISTGAIIQALALRLFLVPANLASGGISGLAQIINYYTGFPIGVMVLLGNIPLFLVGWRYLGGPRFATRTAYAVIAYSIFVDLLVSFLPAHGLTDDLILNALFGGVISGIGFGLVYLGRGTSGGSDILARILSRWRGISISQSYLLTDAIIVLLAGITFRWENALYSLVNLYVSGLSAEAVTQGSNVVRTALIITSQPSEVANQILFSMERGVTKLTARGAYTDSERTVLYCVISRSEVAQVKTLVQSIDPHAFMVIGNAHEALGEGFQSFNN